MIRLPLLLGGLKSYFPFLPSDYTGTGGTVSARYCYSVWLRHQALLREAGFTAPIGTMIELGPGDSIGVGLAALLTGVERYLGLDVVRHNNDETNLRLLDELVALFARRSDIPDATEWPGLFPTVPDYRFAAAGVDEGRLATSLASSQIEAIRAAIRQRAAASDDQAMIRYVCPWFDEGLVAHGSVDLVLGQGVLQDMDDTAERPDLARAVRRMNQWLRAGGIMAHQIELGCEGAVAAWNEHWTYPDWAWRIVRGRRPYYKNRAPLSRYLSLFAQEGFEVVTVQPVHEPVSMSRALLAERFRSLPDEDLHAKGVYIVARKRA